MNINSTIKKKLLKQNITIEKSTNIKDVKNFIKRFKNNYKSVDLQRIGSNKDGGYLIPNILKDVKYCFSPGVDDKVSFEKFLIDKYGIICFSLILLKSSITISDPNEIKTYLFLLLEANSLL